MWDEIKEMYAESNRLLIYQLKHEISSINTNDIFSLIHVNLWGPYPVNCISSAFYFLTIIDDFSRVTWTYLLKEKTSVSNTLKYFCNLI